LIIHNPITDHAQLKNVTTSQHHVKTAGTPFEKPLVANSYVLPGWAWNGSDTPEAAIGTCFVPIDVADSMSFDRIGVKASSTGGGTGRLGYYNSTTVDGQVYPTTLISDSGTVDLSADGIKQITIDWTPDAGILYLAYSNATACSLSGPNENTLFKIPVGGNSNSSSVYNAQYNILFSETEYESTSLPSDVSDLSIFDYFLSPKKACIFLRLA